MKRLYFDHNATTPIAEAVFKAMSAYLKGVFGNPSSVHALGREAKGAIEQARLQVADLIGAAPEEIVFVSGGTESINLAISGTAALYKGGRIIASQVEHPAVLNSCAYLERAGFEVIYLPVDSRGIVEIPPFTAALTPDTRLISIMLANNETGSIQPIKELAAIAREQGLRFHTDAVQAVGKLPLKVDELGVQLLSLSGHKLYGPKGIGALYIRSGTKIMPQLHGGHHERGLRPGTENITGIVGLGAACQLAKAHMIEDAAYISKLANTLWYKLNERIEGLTLNGHAAKKLPGTLNISFAGISGESLLMNLDLEGIAVSAGSACSAGSLKASHVLLALGLSEEQARSSLRISIGRDNTLAEIDTLVEALCRIVARLRGRVGKVPCD